MSGAPGIGTKIADTFLCRVPCCGTKFAPMNDAEVQLKAQAAANRIKAAEITMFVVALLLALLVVAQVYTNFASPSAVPGHVAAEGLNAMATQLFIAGAALAFIIGLALEGARQRAQKTADAAKARLPVARLTQDIADKNARAIAEDLKNLQDSTLLVDGRNGENAFHALAATAANRPASTPVAVAANAAPAQPPVNHAAVYEAFVKDAITALLAAAGKSGAIDAADANGDSPLDAAFTAKNVVVFNQLKAAGAVQKRTQGDL